MNKCIGENRLTYLWGKIKGKFATKQEVADSILIPNMDNMTPIRTIEFDVARTAYNQLFMRSNTGISATMSEVNDVVLFRITVTGTNIYARADVLVKFRSGVLNVPQIFVNYDTYSTSAATTGIQYLRPIYPKTLNSGYNWIMDFNCYNDTSRHIKVEVFGSSENITWVNALTDTTYNSTYHTAGSALTLYTSRGLIWNNTLGGSGYVNGATSSVYISGYLPKYIGVNVIKAGEALVEHDIAFFNNGYAYKIGNKNVEISPDYGICGIGTSYSVNGIIGYAYLREVRLSNFNTPANHGLTYDTFAMGDKVYLRCTMKEGKIYSDAHLAKKMSKGYTWYLLGAASTATQIGLNTTASMFITLDESGLISHINGKPTQAALMTTGVEEQNTWLEMDAKYTSDVEVRSIGGKSVVWNQLVGSLSSTRETGGIQITNNYPSMTFYGTATSSGAKDIAYSLPVVVGHIYYVSSGEFSGTINLGGRTCTNPGILTTQNSVGTLSANVTSGVFYNVTFEPMVFDLTAKFGAGYEPATVEEFEAMFPQHYYSHKVATMTNVVMSGVKGVDAQGNTLGTASIDVTTLTGKPSGSNTSEVMFADGLKGIGSVYDEIDFEQEKAWKRLGMVDLGDLSWTKNMNNTQYYASITNTVSDRTGKNVLCSKYEGGDSYGSADMKICIYGNYVWVRDSNYSTASDLDSSLSGVKLVYELATPIEYTLDDSTIKKYRTVLGGKEVVLPTASNDVTSAPVKLGLRYKNDKLDKLSTSTDNAIVRFDGTSGAIQNSGVTINDSNHVTAAKFITSGGTSSQFVKGDGTLDSTSYAPLASPALTGTPTAPTATAGTNTTQVATTAFVKGEVDTALGNIETLLATI